MTTIAFRDGVLAADTAIIDRGCYCGQAVKIFRSSDGKMGGLAGCLGDSALFRDWFLTGADGEAPEFKDDDSEGLLVHPDGKVEWIGPGRKRFPMVAPFHCIGSGYRLALGALHAGASATRAVEIAAAVDNQTRGPFVVLRQGEV